MNGDATTTTTNPALILQQQCMSKSNEELVDNLTNTTTTTTATNSSSSSSSSSKNHALMQSQSQTQSQAPVQHQIQANSNEATSRDLLNDWYRNDDDVDIRITQNPTNYGETRRRQANPGYLPKAQLQGVILTNINNNSNSNPTNGQTWVNANRLIQYKKRIQGLILFNSLEIKLDNFFEIRSVFH